MAIRHLDAETTKWIDPSSGSSWGPEAAETMCNEVRHFQIPSGKHGNLTLGELIDRTPKQMISKVMLEEKIFSTWHDGRTVLLGDGKLRRRPLISLSQLYSNPLLTSYSTYVRMLIACHKVRINGCRHSIVTIPAISLPLQCFSVLIG